MTIENHAEMPDYADFGMELWRNVQQMAVLRKGLRKRDLSRERTIWDCIASPLKVESRTADLQLMGLYMNNQTPNPSAVIAFPNKEDDLDKVGHAASDLIHQAASRAEQRAQQVMSVAHKLSLQLRAAEDRLAALEAEVKHYRHRADRAEKWLHRIALEIQHTFFSSNNGNSQTVDELENLQRFAPKQRQIS